jgi:hypothetical protein
MTPGAKDTSIPPTSKQKRQSRAKKPLPGQDGKPHVNKQLDMDGRSSVGPVKKKWMLDTFIPTYILAQKVKLTLGSKRERDTFMHKCYQRATVLWFETFGYGLPYEQDPVLIIDDNNDGNGNSNGNSNSSTAEGYNVAGNGGTWWRVEEEPADWTEAERMKCYKRTKKVR